MAEVKKKASSIISTEVQSQIRGYELPVLWFPVGHNYFFECIHQSKDCCGWIQAMVKVTYWCGVVVAVVNLSQIWAGHVISNL